MESCGSKLIGKSGSSSTPHAESELGNMADSEALQHLPLSVEQTVLLVAAIVESMYVLVGFTATTSTCLPATSSTVELLDSDRCCNSAHQLSSLPCCLQNTYLSRPAWRAD